MQSNIKTALEEIKNREEAIHVVDYVESQEELALYELTTALSKSRHVTLLSFSQCVFTEDDARLFFELLKNNRVLINLQFDRCSFSNAGEEILLQGLECNISILYFSFFGEKLNKNFDSTVESIVTRNKQLFDACYAAAKISDVENCIRFLEMGVSPYALQTSLGIKNRRNTVLHCAVINKHVGLVNVLLNYFCQNDFDINFLDHDVKTAFQRALEMRQAPTLEVFEASSREYGIAFDFGVIANEQSVINQFLQFAAKEGLVLTVNLLIKSGADVNSTDDDGTTPLLSAINNRHEAVVKLLLSNKADVNYTHPNGVTALSSAVQFGDVGIVKMLLEAGADAAEENVQQAIESLESKKCHLDVVSLIRLHIEEHSTGIMPLALRPSWVVSASTMTQAISLQDSVNFMLRVIHDNLMLKVNELAQQVGSLMPSRNTQQITPSETTSESLSIPRRALG